MPRYFAYGSNLSLRQMEQRCAIVRPVAPATLPDHRLVFAGASKNWNGAAVATIVADPSRLVHGFVYELSTEALERLDVFEGSYDRRAIQLDDGEAWTYVRRSAIPRGAPSPAYLAIMAHAYGVHGHPLEALLNAIEAKSHEP